MKSKEIKSLAFSTGIIWGFMVMFLSWISNTGWGVDIIEVLSSFYIGLKPTLIGGLLGFIWAFVNGFILVMGIGHLYKYILNKK